MGMSASRENIHHKVISDDNLSTRLRQISVTKCDINDDTTSTEISSEKILVDDNNKMKIEGSWLVYSIFYLLGCGTLLPWNFFITANEYFKHKLENNGKLSIQFQNYFSVASMGPNLVAMVLNVLLLHRFSRYIRICTSLVIMAAMFALTTVLVLIDFSESPEIFFAITIGKMVIINVASAVLQGALFGMVVSFPGRYIQAVMAGQGLGGVFAVVANLASLLGQNSIQMSALGYFSTATIVLLISLVAYISLERMAFVKSYTKSNEKSDLLFEEFSMNDESAKRSEKNTKNKNKLLVVIQQILPMALSSFVVFLVTLAVFPSTTARINSVSNFKNEWTRKFFVPVTCFLIFNLGDYGGKILTGFIQKPDHRSYWLLVLSIARIGFVPLFVFSNVQPRLNGSSVYFNSDVFPIIFMVLFSVSNGYLASLSVIYAPRLVSSEHTELAGTMMAFSIVAGLAAGAGFSFLIAPNI